MVTYRDNVNEDEFLSHSSNSGGYDKDEMLGAKWRKRGGPGYIDVWLYTRFVPRPLWRHPLSQVKVIEDRKTREVTKAVWSDPMPCFEDERVLKKRTRDEEGNREEPFRRCPVCRLTEEVRRLVREKKLGWFDPIFEYRGTKSGDFDLTIHAATGAGMINQETLTPEQMQQMRAAGIQQGGWRERISAKLEYVFIVASEADPRQLKIAIETSLLGDRVKNLIKKTKLALRDDDRGSPFKNPYCIRWLYDEKARMNEKYDALRMEEVPLSPQVKKLIQSPNGPDVSRFFQHPDLRTLRAKLEQHATPQLKRVLDWDLVFDVPSPDDSGEAPRVASEVRSEKKTDKIPCEDCGTLLSPTDTKCPKCGATYEVDDEPEAHDPIAGDGPPPPPFPTTKALEVSKLEGRPRVQTPAAVADEYEVYGDDEDIPF